MPTLSEKNSSEAVRSGEMTERARTPTEKSETTNVAESTISDDASKHITGMEDIENFQIAKTTSNDVKEREEQDPNIVGWDSEDDPANPMNWTLLKKWTNVGLISAITFIVPLASSMFAPGVAQVSSDFNETNPLLQALVVSIYVIGLAIGPLVQAPMSEVYGRWIVYATCNILYVVFTVACAVSSNISMLIVFRFFAGCFGSAPVTIGGGTIADLFPPQQRGRALSLYTLGPVAGPAIGPIAGGFLSQSEGWKWIFWVLAIASGVITVGHIIFCHETSAVVILNRKVKRLQKETGNMNLRSKLDRQISNTEVLKRAIVRPAKLTILSPISVLMSVSTAVVYGNLYLMLTTITAVFEVSYGWSTGISGLAYIGMGVGNVIGLLSFSITSDKYLQQKSAKGLQLKPEDRLPLMLLSGPAIAAGMFWYGWSAKAQTHWIVPILGSSLVGAGNMFFFMPMMGYLVDAYTIYAASALAANTVLRSIGGGLLPLAGQSMYKSLGYGWGNSLLGFIMIGFTPVVLFIYRYGEYIRTRWPLNLD
ncbi:bicyclomycin resistance protein, putative [Talaromyces stipitatus ATCC 10500]|uniref:Bicyclomycin resistance protein, putative n=1 Tax=Talaromyces stipitatus (strain ATCC 10500 / CBS 375.48 / QM 6759 / NRRL 1006) TaxID=441959 RepID=B8M537_TALSN|nr:bicyclomycin resistance protein, putative [Talaromyces stipitatus ATCC 10500]EED19643.1 bicyclomycin resistance protein, putative [Talaromyces stipitatus ATCC 10500]